MKNIGKKALALSLALQTLAFSVACGGTDDGKATLYFMYAGQTTEVADVYQDLVDEFNRTKGEELGFSVEPQPKPYSSYDTTVSNFLIGTSGPDIVMLNDETFKVNCGFLSPLDSYVKDSNVLDNIYGNLKDRVYYNTSTSKVDDEANLYAIPFYNNATVTYVNISQLKKAKVKYISVAQEDLDAWNAGTIADENGVRKSDLGISIDVPAKGFYRESPFVDGGRWSIPSSSETMIFNDKIAMNWDEVEDLGRIMTKKATLNPTSPTDYGFYTEWWFPYAWTVGGDCLLDLNGNGDYKFGLQENYPNYIVTKGTYQGAVTGTTYNVGETIAFADKIAVENGEGIVANDDGTFSVNGEEAVVRSEIVAESQNEDGCLSELPSMKNAFTRFAKLAAKEYDSTRISPYPTTFTSTNSITYFTSQALAMIVERVSNLGYVSKNLGSNTEWTIAPLPVYKEYTDPANPACDTVKVQGATSGHSHLSSIGVRKNSLIKDKSYQFIAWAVTEGQSVLANAGFGSVSSTMENVVGNTKKYVKNTDAILLSTKNSHLGDWGYLKDRFWIDGWANPLNEKVRNGTETLEEFFVKYVKTTNTSLKNY